MNEAQILFQKHCEDVNKTYRAVEIRDLRKNHSYSINLSLSKILESFLTSCSPSFKEKEKNVWEIQKGTIFFTCKFE